MDPLSDLLSDLRISPDDVRALSLTDAWSLATPPGARFVHVVVAGQCELVAPGKPRGLTLGPKDLVVAGRGHPHLLRSLQSPHPDPVLIETTTWQPGRTPTLRAAPGLTRLVSAPFELDANGFPPGAAELPEVVIVRAEQRPVPRSLRPVLDSVVAEVANSSAGSAFLLARLLEALLVEALRVYLIEMDGRERGWFRVLADPVLNTALEHLNGSKSRVAVAASHAQRGRNQFSARFAALSGESPRAYLARQRIRRAKKLIRAGGLPLRAVADATGFTSLRSLCRAFRRETGTTPGAYRRKVRPRLSRPSAPAVPDSDQAPPER